MTITAQVRWMIRRDWPEVIEIERRCFGDEALSISELKAFSSRPTVIPYVVEIGGDVIGHMLYRLDPGKLTLIRLAIHPNHQRQSYGSQLITRLKSKLDIGRREEILCNVPERNLPAQLFLSSHGFIATHPVGDRYPFVWRVKSEVSCA